MTDLATIPIGTMLFTRGTNVYGDSRIGGMYVREDDPTEDGERQVTILTNSPLRPRQASLILHHEHKTRNSYEQLGLVHRLQALKVSDIDPHAADNFRTVEKVWKAARSALIAAALPPNNHIGSRLHNDLLQAYWVLRDEAVSLERGVG